MTPADWRKLRDEVLRVSNAELARRVGVTKDTGAKYAREGSSIPDTVALACAAVARGIQPWPK